MVLAGGSVRWRRIGVAVLTCLTLAACSQTTITGEGGPVIESTPTGDVPAGLGRYYSQQLSWGPCAPFAITTDDRRAYADPAYECARLEVPLDYAQPEGATAQVAVMRRRATGPRIGSLVFNPGGPGGSGLRSLATNIGPTIGNGKLSQRFDIVGFDPRGVGASIPAIDCLTDAEWDLERADSDLDTTPEGVAETEAENRRYAEQCAERSGGAEVLANVGTRDVARDLDVLRAALGDEKLTYLGYSYGTLLGALYAEAFPQNVRALVLDGAVDPAQSNLESSESQYDGFDMAFDEYAADCALDPSCPLGSTPGQADQALDSLFLPLVDNPAPAEGGTRTLSYDDAYTGLDAALYNSSGWPELTQGLSELAAGDGTILLHLADFYYGRGANGGYDNETEAFVAIRCADDERVTRADLDADEALDTCAFWPAPPTLTPHMVAADGLPRTLVISTTGDPATPYDAGVSLAASLKSSLLTAEGNQHTASLSGNSCVDDVMAAYLIDLTLPPDGTRCVL